MALPGVDGRRCSGSRVKVALNGAGAWRLIETDGDGFEVIGNKASPTGADTPNYHFAVHTASLNNDQWVDVLCDTVGSGSYLFGASCYRSSSASIG